MDVHRRQTPTSPPATHSSTFIDTHMKQFLPRRTFVQLCSALGAYLASPSTRKAVADPLRNSAAVKNRKNFVAIQMKPHAWLDEGIDKVLDNIQQRGNVNTVWAYTYDYDMGARNT